MSSKLSCGFFGTQSAVDCNDKMEGAIADMKANAEARQAKEAKEALKPVKQTVYITKGGDNENADQDDNSDGEFDDLLEGDDEVNRIMESRMAALKKAVDTRKEGNCNLFT